MLTYKTRYRGYANQNNPLSQKEYPQDNQRLYVHRYKDKYKYLSIYISVMWIRIQRYKITDKMKRKAELTNNKKFSQEIIFFMSEPKKK